jgi:hypothetical protein
MLLTFCGCLAVGVGAWPCHSRHPHRSHRRIHWRLHMVRAYSYSYGYGVWPNTMARQSRAPLKGARRSLGTLSEQTLAGTGRVAVVAAVLPTDNLPATAAAQPAGVWRLDARSAFCGSAWRVLGNEFWCWAASACSSIRQGFTHGMILLVSLLSFPRQVQVPAQALVHTPRRCLWHCLDSAVHPDGSGCIQGV